MMCVYHRHAVCAAAALIFLCEANVLSDHSASLQLTLCELKNVKFAIYFTISDS